jgi:hypothetical protein
MQKQIEKLNEKVLRSIGETYPIGLAQGEMGICIYFYYLFRIEGNENYKKIAEQLLDDTLNKISKDFSISVESGLGGIGLGITHLIKVGFVDGDVNEILEDIDNVIFKRLAFLQNNSSYKKEELLHLIFYLHVRLTDLKDKHDQYIYKELIIKILNIFSDGLGSDFFDEPFGFSIYHYHLPLFTYICARLLEQGFYNERILKMLKEFEPKILYRLPLMHTNRLYLLCGILQLIPYMQNTQWKDYSNLLKKEITLPIIFEQEMKNKHIFISNGLSMVYLLLYYLEKNYPDNKIEYNTQDFCRKIVSSESWNSLLKHDYYFNIHSGLLNGFPGVQLVLLHFQKQKYI